VFDPAWDRMKESAMRLARTDYYHRFIYGQPGVEVMEMIHQNGDLSEIYVTDPQGGFSTIYAMVFRPDGSFVNELHITVDSLTPSQVNSWDDLNNPFRLGCEWAEATSGSPMLED
jgi:hypothetical protein